MRIGFIAEPYEESNASGMGYVVLEFLRQLALREDGDTLVIYSAKPVNPTVIPGRFENVIVPKSFIKKFFWFMQFKGDVDVLVFITPLLPLWISKKVKTILLCQELYMGEIAPKGIRAKMFSFIRDRVLMSISVARARAVVVPSLATKKDFLKFFRVPEEKVILIHDGFQDLSVYKGQAPAIDPSLKPYFVFVGKVKPRKNVHNIVSGFIDFKKRTGAGAKLVIAGDYGGEYYQGMMREVRENNLESDVFFVGYATGATMYAYYENALALVYPSIHEGFGMPIPEAMSLGVPVITSKISSMPEVAGDAGVLVDPFDKADIGAAMEKIFTDDAFRAELVVKGREQAKKFSWETSTEELLKLAKAL